MKEAEEKLEKMTLERSHFEAEAKRNSRIVDNLSALLQIERERAEAAAPQGATTAARVATSVSASAAATTVSALAAASTTAASAASAPRFPDKKCFKFERGQCKSKNCAFVHPTSCCAEFSRTGICRDRDCLDMHLGEHKADCWFWRMGSCRFDESECGRGLHRPEMLESIKGRKEKEAGARKEQVVSGGNPASWTAPAATTAPAPAASQASFFGGGWGNKVLPS